MAGPTPPGVVRMKPDNYSAQRLTYQKDLINLSSEATGDFPSVCNGVQLFYQRPVHGRSPHAHFLAHAEW